MNPSDLQKEKADATANYYRIIVRDTDTVTAHDSFVFVPSEDEDDEKKMPAKEVSDDSTEKVGSLPSRQPFKDLTNIGSSPISSTASMQEENDVATAPAPSFRPVPHTSYIPVIPNAQSAINEALGGTRGLVPYENSIPPPYILGGGLLGTGVYSFCSFGVRYISLMQGLQVKKLKAALREKEATIKELEKDREIRLRCVKTKLKNVKKKLKNVKKKIKSVKEKGKKKIKQVHSQQLNLEQQINVLTQRVGVTFNE